MWHACRPGGVCLVVRNLVFGRGTYHCYSCGWACTDYWFSCLCPCRSGDVHRRRFARRKLRVLQHLHACDGRRQHCGSDCCWGRPSQPAADPAKPVRGQRPRAPLRDRTNQPEGVHPRGVVQLPPRHADDCVWRWLRLDQRSHHFDQPDPVSSGIQQRRHWEHQCLNGSGSCRVLRVWIPARRLQEARPDLEALRRGLWNFLFVVRNLPLCCSWAAPLAPVRNLRAPGVLWHPNCANGPGDWCRDSVPHARGCLRRFSLAVRQFAWPGLCCHGHVHAATVRRHPATWWWERVRVPARLYAPRDDFPRGNVWTCCARLAVVPWASQASRVRAAAT
mmetsp:Transcript_25530/g.58883  ORF Transcript_25530/g.58883 Transcript_25530/m.58883 type:complete len:334 (+) Transcript_25530:420-1421(+)